MLGIITFFFINLQLFCSLLFYIWWEIKFSCSVGHQTKCKHSLLCVKNVTYHVWNTQHIQHNIYNIFNIYVYRLDCDGLFAQWGWIIYCRIKLTWNGFVIAVKAVPLKLCLLFFLYCLSHVSFQNLLLVTKEKTYRTFAGACYPFLDLGIFESNLIYVSQSHQSLKLQWI